MKPISKLGLIVCADDFGASSDVNDAIISLLKDERISAVSCLATGQAWELGASALKSFRGVVDIGLHLFYEEMPFNKILAHACAQRLSKQEVFKRFSSQLDCFMKSMGMPPDYIDGHQHIHQLPVFRSALMDLISTYKLNKIYVRNSAISLNDVLVRRISILKNIFIALPGFLLKKNLNSKKIPSNNDFLGIYDFTKIQAPQDIFEKLLRTVKKANSILISHPRCGDKLFNGNNNVFDRNRVKEFTYLQSNQYKETLERYGLYLTRFSYASVE